MKKRFLAAMLLSLILIPLFAANDSTADRYMKSANEQYGLGNFAKAYTYINYVLEQYNEKTVTLNVKLLAELIYYDYLGDIETKKDLTAFRSFQDSVNDFPYIVSDRIQKKLDSLVPTFEKLAEQEAKAKAAAASSSSKTTTSTQSSTQTSQSSSKANADTVAEIHSAMDELYKKLEALSETEKMVFSQDMKTQQQKIVEQLNNSTEEIRTTTDKSADGTRLLITILIIVIIALISIVVSVIVMMVRLSHRQKELFTTTLRLVSEVKKLPLEISNSTIYRIEDKINDFKIVNKEQPEPAPKPAPDPAEEPAPEPEKEEEQLQVSIPKVEDDDISEELRAKLRDLASECESHGADVDARTGRKNNSRKIAELVFKIAKEMNAGDYYSMLYYCASMVYDIGFMDVDQALFTASELTEDQKKTVREHVHTGVDLLSFIPDDFRPLFVDAVCLHHENPDGSGYPDGVKQKRLPEIARILRVVESYVAMTSKRPYHGMKDAESAVEELKKNPGWYDQSIVEILENQL